MAIETSIAIIVLAASISFYALRHHGDTVNFDVKYRPELDQIKKRVSLRFKNKAIELLVLIVTDGTNKFDNLKDLSREQIDNNASRINLPEKISELSNILSEIERVKSDYRKIREFKKRMENRLFIMSLVVGINAAIPYLSIPSPPTPATIEQFPFLIILMIDFLSSVVALDIISSYRTYSSKEEEFLKRLDDEDVNSGEVLSTYSDKTSDD